MADPMCTFPCSVNSIPFSPEISGRRVVDAAPNLGHQRYIQSLLTWQTKLPYYYKCLFTDIVTFQFKTQRNGDSFLNPARLYICGSQVNSESGNPNPVPGSIITAFTTPLNSTYFWGAQSPEYDTYTNPPTGFTQRLSSFMWSFSFGSVLNYLTDSGIYFIKFVNTSEDGLTQDVWYSEPILLYGIDALECSNTRTTLLFEGNNSYNKNDIIMDGWDVAVGVRPVFRTRIEADILDYDPKGIYLGYLRDSWLQEQTLESSWETFTLNVGSISGGIPVNMFRIISKICELDTLYINNVAYIYDSGTSSSTAPTNAWKMKKPRIKGLIGGTLPIRYKYNDQFYAAPFTEDYRIFTEEFSDVFS